jgi:hypothetical protein
VRLRLARLRTYLRAIRPFTHSEGVHNGTPHSISARPSRSRHHRRALHRGACLRRRHPGNPGNPGNPQIPDNPNPAPPVAGGYTIGLINSSNPGQNVLLANPNGGAIGLYRFLETSTLVLDPLGGYTLTFEFADDTHSYTIHDQGGWKAGNPGQDGSIDLSFKSDTYDDEFPGLTRNGRLEIQYDFDGDGNIDTLFGFERQ